MQLIMVLQNTTWMIWLYLHFNHTNIKFKELVGSGKKEITFDYVEISKALEYAAEDALITLKLYIIF